MENFGFGLMRLPLTNEEDQTSIDQEQLNKMVDLYMDKGFSYFDTAYPYHNGASETSIKKALVERYPRESFQLADKLPLFFLQKEEDMEQFFNEELKRCGVEYFDYYLLHNVSTWTRNAFEKIDSFGFCKQKKEEGKIKHLGISFHDSAEMLEEVLSKHPEIEFVQLQINYLDWENDSIQSKKCYEVARKYNKPVIVMESIKGGALAQVPEEAEKIFNEYNSKLSVASWALRYCRSLDGILMVLSGMNTIEQMEDNLKSMTDFKPLTNEEYSIIDKACDIINQSIAIPCTTCGYCLESCPKNIPIPSYFTLYNAQKRDIEQIFSTQGVYYRTMTLKEDVGAATDCIECGQCVEHCPQHLEIPELLKDVAKMFENDV
jgi:predicted aldo/keto reductase-like oxidoreductase